MRRTTAVVMVLRIDTAFLPILSVMQNKLPRPLSAMNPALRTGQGVISHPFFGIRAATMPCQGLYYF
jgi:hypothetical protein